MNGWIALSRKLLDWQWHDEPKMVALWVHILLRACQETTKYRGITTLRGQLATTYKSLAAAVGLSHKEVRLCVQRLKDEESITVGYIKGTCIVISVCNYNQYQASRKATQRHNTRADHATPLTPKQSATYEPSKDTQGQTEGRPKVSQKALKGQTEGISKGTKRADLTNCVSINYAKNSQTSGNTLGMTEGTEKALKGLQKGLLYNNKTINNNTVVVVDARESQGETPSEGTTIKAKDANLYLYEIMNSPTYSPIVLMRSHMTPETVQQFLPEFVAQCQVRDETWKDIRALTEHFANWLAKKATIPKPPTPETRADQEQARHQEVVTSALNLMLSSTRDD